VITTKGRKAAGVAGVAGRRKVRAKRGRLYVLVGILLCLAFLVPLLWPVIRSLEPEALTTSPPSGGDFTRLSLVNYRLLFGGSVGILRALINSAVVGMGVAVLTAFLSTLAGYGLGRFRFRGREVVFLVLLLALMVPFQSILTPLFLELQVLHLTDSLVGLVIIYTTFILPFGVFIMRNSFERIPREIEESARVDGASSYRVLLHVLRPLVSPGIATTALFAVLFSWTEFLAALTFLTTPSNFTLPVALLNIEMGTYGAVNYGLLEAGAVVAMIPPIILYLCLQRYYVAGLMSGAVKG
jgi:multiple sugar transport system permease protein